tara:strand:- start:11566 stop:11805 length:240 start_codon:yes stop_codon:yes gene_type:complete
MEEKEQQPIIERKMMNTLQLMALVAMLLTLLTGESRAFAVATAMMCSLKLVSMVIYEDSKEAIFATIYAGFAIMFFFNL